MGRSAWRKGFVWWREVLSNLTFLDGNLCMRKWSSSLIVEDEGFIDIE